MVAKVAGGIIGLGLIGTGGVAFVKPEWFGMDYIPGFHALSKDNDYDTKKTGEYGTGKFGNKYRNYLVGVTKKKDDKDSKAWWEWAFRQLKKEGVDSGKFKVSGEGDKNVDSPFGGDEKTKALNQVCKEAYKTNTSDVTETGENGSKFKKSEVWKYCSPLGKEPEKINKSNYDDKIGSENENFISAAEGANTLFWFIRDKEIKEESDNFEKITVTSGGTSNHFQQQGKSLRELCEAAYNTPKNPPSNNPTKEETQKYCVFELTPAT